MLVCKFYFCSSLLYFIYRILSYLVVDSVFTVDMKDTEETDHTAVIRVCRMHKLAYFVPNSCPRAITLN